ncbi:MAG TPA: tRNA (adenosine(37)-N6)-dimethylallyltransferase MiaA [Clostridia bacterium]|nr:tRNA (adenosine(37)-N6)-dimethylallyltransferase MiaA [Clostridia bacterium]
MLIIGGATATGKSELAIQLAKKFNGEIISADSMQIYKGMDKGTAKINEEEKEGIPHHLIDVVEPDQSFSVADFKEMADNIVADVKARAKLPIIVGGTGLYINSLIYDYKLSDNNPRLREELNKEYEKFGADYMYEKLAKFDPLSAEKIHRNNVKRVIRALEVYLTTRKSIHDKADKQNFVPHLMYAINYPREILYARINERVEKMFASSLVEEVKCLIDKGYGFDLQSMQAIGYKEFKEYFAGKITLEETKELIKQHTRNYAKRQETWFKRIDTCKWLNFNEKERFAEIISNDITDSNLI